MLEHGHDDLVYLVECIEPLALSMKRHNIMATRPTVTLSNARNLISHIACMQACPLQVGKGIDFIDVRCIYIKTDEILDKSISVRKVNNVQQKRKNWKQNFQF